MWRIIAGVIAMLLTSESFAQEQPLNVAEWSSAIDILKKSRSLIESGWYQVNPIPDSNCIATAIEASWKESGKSLSEFDYVKLAINYSINSPPAEKLTSKSDPLSTPYWGRYYMYWNDTSGRTKKDVIDAFDRAIEFANKRREEAMSIRLSGNTLSEFDRNMMQGLGLAPAQ